MIGSTDRMGCGHEIFLTLYEITLAELAWPSLSENSSDFSAMTISWKRGASFHRSTSLS